MMTPSILNSPGTKVKGFGIPASVSERSLLEEPSAVLSTNLRPMLRWFFWSCFIEVEDARVDLDGK